MPKEFKKRADGREQALEEPKGVRAEDARTEGVRAEDAEGRAEDGHADDAQVEKKGVGAR